MAELKRAGVRTGARLGPAERLKSKLDFERVRREGRRAGDGVLRLLVARNALGWSRIASAIPRRHGPAVTRNRLRRLYTEAFRLDKATLPRGVDIVVSPAGGETLPDLAAVRASLGKLVAQAAARLAPPADSTRPGARPAGAAGAE